MEAAFQLGAASFLLGYEHLVDEGSSGNSLPNIRGLNTQLD